MRIRSAVAELPARVVTNDDIVGWIGEHSAGHFEGDLDAALRKVDYYLRYAGSRERRWLDAGERPIDLLRRAANTALDRAEVRPEDVDLLIYTGIGRGFIEPGGAYHSAAALGLRNAHCFDILDACMSWTRAVQVTDALFRSGTHRTAMIVNAECNLRSGGVVFPHLFRIPEVGALESVFPAYTLGEAATATVLTAEDNEPWRFEFASRPDLAPLCNVTLDGYDGYCDPSDKLAANGVGFFTSYGFEMHEQGAADAHAVFERLDPPVGEVAALFTHASSQRYWQGMADKAGLGHAIHHVFERTGNVVSASVPAAIASALELGVLAPGERAVGWVGSAGMSFAAFSFVL
ncbi:3-oxoacyl-[acyl-carrier-protein] synthase III [Nocardia farcinica]|uniref:3-oxoacyl-[acyl-carrier-protein] synthase 3 n=1 Tax=Nocardia farcinica TaxID=37329 RepID=A0A0H5NQ24_NOCFR|nr:3-oxoacyl-[acyl-carrier-protein] synthase III C-terminal domain-containing protein [Nocardia farcinica]AXK85889.1 3-oxoacyl-ACP reductase [Nocardia farcinica]CRY77955.1 3-oxoacyl-[acyl-carrier-protein] synthase 3 [Nocardia farcinica]SIS87672.1 3-oxoacyl-[acyl-carrier-protein] synthase III [Nocardia farcinica]